MMRVHRLPIVVLVALLAPAVLRAGEEASVGEGRGWWAFRPVARPEVPRVGAGEGEKNPIDAFVGSARREVGVEPSAEADRETLIRRVTLDLTGLPPSPEEVDAFLADDRPGAYERVVDRLLALPAYGERWASAWLDLARYADTAGFEEDTRRPQAWRYRDWVVRALNDDMPYDRFVRLQIAADEVEPGNPAQKAALGFLRSGPAVGNQKTERIRLDELDDVVSTTSSVFLGLTVGCARCHDHKFDPIPTADYYRMLAVFAPGRPAEVSLASPAEQAAYRLAARAVEEEADRARAEVMEIERSARERVERQKRAGLPKGWRRAVETGDLSGLSAPEQIELGKRLKVAPQEVEDALSALDCAVRDEWRARVAAIEARKPAPLPQAPGVVESGRPAPVHVLIRGEVDREGEAVRPGPPRAVAGRLVNFEETRLRSGSSGRRSALAGWIASGSNPLTARVLVNRLWQGHFGVGLVATPSDFGAMGEAPSLPALLDWLAAEFIAQGWSQKAMHRLIVTSATYRQSSRIRPEAQAIDPDNSLLWRFPVRRLEAEAIRDAVLWCAGTLNPTQGGPGVFPPIDPGVVRTGNLPRWPLDANEGPEVWRRSLYVFRMRSVPMPLLEVFDLPDAAQSCPRRASTTTPTQSLSLLNNPFVLDQARRFAARVARQAGPEPDARLALAHRLATGRRPDAARRQTLAAFLREQTRWHRDHASPEPDLAALADLCHVLFNSNAFLYLD